MHRDTSPLVAYEQVLCLECALVYAKPTRGGTTQENPGCPRCGYVGWIAIRSHADQPSGRGGLRRTG